ELVSRGLAFPEKGETWEKLSERIYGNAALASNLLRMNRDRHTGDISSEIVSGRLVRLINIPESQQMVGVESQVARKSD
ncbi:MAG: hypothetical protein RJA81_1082, partial [Planctomycetota bacterium]